MAIDLTDLLKLPSDEKERIALALLQQVDGDDDDFELSAEQEAELDKALEEVEKGNLHHLSLTQLQSMIESQWKKP